MLLVDLKLLGLSGSGLMCKFSMTSSWLCGSSPDGCGYLVGVSSGDGWTTFDLACLFSFFLSLSFSFWMRSLYLSLSAYLAFTFQATSPFRANTISNVTYFVFSFLKKYGFLEGLIFIVDP